MSEPALEPEPQRRPAPFTFKKLVVFRERIDGQQDKADPAVLERLEEEYSKKLALVAAAEGVPADELDRRVHREIYGDVELVPEDDAVIGRALRVSAVALGVLAVIALAVWLWINRPQAARAEQTFQVAAPEAVAAAAVAAPALPFVDVAREAGIDFVHANGATGDKLLPETMGGGGAFFDYDGDGDVDLLLVNGAPWPWGPQAAQRPDAAPLRNDGRAASPTSPPRPGLAVPSTARAWRSATSTTTATRPLLHRRRRQPPVREPRWPLRRGHREAGVGGDPQDAGAPAPPSSTTTTTATSTSSSATTSLVAEIDFEVDYRLTGVGRAYGPPANYEGTHSPLPQRRRRHASRTSRRRPASGSTTRPPASRPARRSAWCRSTSTRRLDRPLRRQRHRRQLLLPQPGRRHLRRGGGRLGLAYDRDGQRHRRDGHRRRLPPQRRRARRRHRQLRQRDDLGLRLAGRSDALRRRGDRRGHRRAQAAARSPSASSSSTTTSTAGSTCCRPTATSRRRSTRSTRRRPTARAPSSSGTPARTRARPSSSVDAETTGDLARPIVGRGSAYADIDGDGDLDVVLLQTGGPPLLLENDQELGHHWLRVDLEGATSHNRSAR
jgi:enediyne biosynthesis protein E4